MFGWLRSKRAASNDAATVPVAAAPPAARSALTLYREGRAVEASAAAVAQLQTDPHHIESKLVQGLLLLDERRHADALALLEALATAAPDQAAVHAALSRALRGTGRRPAAQTALQHALSLDPTCADALLQTGQQALAAGRHDEALRQLSAAVAADPALAEAHYELGNLMRDRKRLAEAEQHYRHAVAARPTHAAALANLGALLKDRGRIDEAAGHLEAAVAADRDLAAAAFTLGMIRVGQSRWRDAAALFTRYVTLAPKDADGHYRLGNAAMGDGDAATARKAYAAAVKQNDGFVQARWGLAMAQLPAVPTTDDEQEQAPQAFEREIKRLRSWFAMRQGQDGSLAVGAQQPYYLAYVPQDHRAVLDGYGRLATGLMGAWARKVGVPAPGRSTGSTLRIGIASAHIHAHSVWLALLRGWVEHLDPKRFEVHLFHTGAARDNETTWASQRAARLHQGVGDWKAWARQISDARVDVMIYPEIGMDSTTARLASLRLARVQLASWGHPITTGLPTMDGYISAEAFEPEGAATHYVERLITLPRLGCCYRPFGTAAARVDLAAHGIADSDRLLLCPGTAFKYAPRDDAVLVDIARRCRPCKLVFFCASNSRHGEMLEQRLRRAFDAGGVDFDACVRFIPWQTQAGFFGLLDRADVFLDTIGFSGFNTAMQAVERGTPIVAWEGEFMRGRFASAILRQAGLAEWVASDAEGYAERVHRLCEDRRLREGVRAQLAGARQRLYDDRATVTALAEHLTALATAS